MIKTQLSRWFGKIVRENKRTETIIGWRSRLRALPAMVVALYVVACTAGRNRPAEKDIRAARNDRGLRFWGVAIGFGSFPC